MEIHLPAAMEDEWNNINGEGGSLFGRLREIGSDNAQKVE
jgi:hypothetical protein